MTEDDPPRPDTLWVLDEIQIRHALSPRRHDIVDRLSMSGPLSVRELAALLGAQPPALYHHITQLLEAGLIVEAGQRVVRRKREQLYQAVAQRVRIDAVLNDPAHDGVAGRIVAGMTRQMERDFKAGLASENRVAEGAGRNLGAFRTVGTPTPRTLRAVNAKLEEIAELLGRDQPGNNASVAFHWLMAPLSPGGPGAQSQADEPD